MTHRAPGPDARKRDQTGDESNSSSGPSPRAASPTTAAVELPPYPEVESAAEHIRNALQILTLLTAQHVPDAPLPTFVVMQLVRVKARLAAALERLNSERHERIAALESIDAKVSRLADVVVGDVAAGESIDVDHGEQERSSPSERRVADGVALLLVALVLLWLLLHLGGCASPRFVTTPAPDVTTSLFLSSVRCPAGTTPAIARRDSLPPLASCEVRRAP